MEKDLEAERKARKEVEKAKEDLEGELESLSQALFGEANKMVADERITRVDTEEEPKGARQEKEALRSALKILESENEVLKGSSSTELSPIITSGDPYRPSRSSLSVSSSELDEQEVEFTLASTGLKTPIALKRTSSQIALKSMPASPDPTPAATMTFAPPPSPPPMTPSDLGDSPSIPASSPPPSSDPISSSSLPLEPSLTRRLAAFETEEEEQREREEEIRNQLNVSDSPVESDSAQSVENQQETDRRPCCWTTMHNAMVRLGAGGASPWADVPSKAQGTKKSGASTFSGQNIRFNIA